MALISGDEPPSHRWAIQIPFFPAKIRDFRDFRIWAPVNFWSTRFRQKTHPRWLCIPSKSQLLKFNWGPDIGLDISHFFLWFQIDPSIWNYRKVIREVLASFFLCRKSSVLDDFWRKMRTRGSVLTPQKSRFFGQLDLGQFWPNSEFSVRFLTQKNRYRGVNVKPCNFLCTHPKMMGNGSFWTEGRRDLSLKNRDF